MARTKAALRSLLAPLLVVLPLLFLASRGAHSRLLLGHHGASADLVSDGTLPRGLDSQAILRLGRAASSFATGEAACEPTYGVLPCTTTAVGNLFLLLVYGYLMFIGATFLSTGSELLLEILGPGIVGGLFLPMLGALPDAILILVSGLSGSRETAQQQVLIGMGLLAGSTIMLLTLLWGSCVVVGKCDLSENSTSIDSQDTKKFSLFGSGISTDSDTSYAARIMVISVVPFVIVQLPKVFKLSTGHRLTVLIALFVSVGLLLSYCLYQVFQPWIQRRRLAYAKHKHVISGLLKHAQKQALGRLLREDGSPNVPVLEKLFERIDADHNGLISRPELKALIIGIQFEEIDLDSDDAVEKVMNDFDTSHDNNIDQEEFKEGITKWLMQASHVVRMSGSHSKFFDHFHKRTKEEHDMLLGSSDEAVESVDNPTLISFKAVLLLLLGTVIAVLFADPLVDAVDNFSSATNIPSFFISFIAMPLATNSSEAVSAIIFASRKKQRTSSLTFSEIYGAVTMNNTLCLAVFLSIVYSRHLTWDFSSEVLIILIVCIVMGLFASFRTNFPLWTSFVAFLLYPFSLVLVYILDFVLGWS
uniref:Vacuolar calcium ion transporter n=1 Tax=Anthurium amnicola TaxID=1678845 RepID=A0A1D1Z0I0_9ARAE